MGGRYLLGFDVGWYDSLRAALRHEGFDTRRFGRLRFRVTGRPGGKATRLQAMDGMDNGLYGPSGHFGRLGQPEPAIAQAVQAVQL